ncbi:MAG: hypothetical protein EPN17_07655 [Methylobacter sp.]|nr:MAG: hypothetical protein EPN17_07655 [Methylobacter sp.]
MKKLTSICTGLLLVSAAVFAEDHSVAALEQANAAVVYGEAGHTSHLLEHAKTALDHLLAASITAKGVSKKYLEDAVTELQEAIDHGDMGHVGAATKHAKAAVRDIKAGNK